MTRESGGTRRQEAMRCSRSSASEYQEFVESFYPAQREITTPHPHSQAIKIMAGVAPSSRSCAVLTEIAERVELLGELNAKRDSADGDAAPWGSGRAICRAP